MKYAFVLLALGLRTLAASEERFNPPLDGVYLGIEVERVDRGYRVTSVTQESAAARAGLRSGDLLVGLGAEPELGVLELERLQELVRSLDRGASVAAAVFRDGKRLDLEIVPDPALARDALHLAAKMKESRFLKSLPEAREFLAGVDGDLLAVVRKSRRTNEAYEGLNRVLGRLGVSHAAVIPPWTYHRMLGSGFEAEDTYHLGLFLQRLPTRDGESVFHVQSIMPGGPAALIGLEVGDELVAVNGVETPRSPRRTLAGFEADREMYVLAVERDETVTVAYRRQAGGAVHAIELRADRPLSSLRAFRESVRLLETPRGPLGYLHFWDLLPTKTPKVLDEILRDELRDARALVVDLRGRGGQVRVLVSVAERLEKDGRPVAALIDAHSRSAKDVLAFLLKGKERFTLIGGRTAGAVRPGQYVKLPSGGMAMLPGSPRPILKITRGVDLEGKGVEPDIKVPFHLPYAAGRDAILERAVDYLTAKLAARRRRRV